MTTVVATPGQGPDRPQEVSYTDTKVIGNGSFGVVYQAKLCDSGELVAIKKVLQDKRFKVRLRHSSLLGLFTEYNALELKAFHKNSSDSLIKVFFCTSVLCSVPLFLFFGVTAILLSFISDILYLISFLIVYSFSKIHFS